LIPESALPPIMRKGVVVVEFSITKDGEVKGMKLLSGSGDVSLDRAAWAAITNAIPLPNLPKDFAGDYLQIRARFYYNPDKNDLE
jgi:TonB family protein